jgi:hypothetical protein
VNNWTWSDGKSLSEQLYSSFMLNETMPHDGDGSYFIDSTDENDEDLITLNIDQIRKKLPGRYICRFGRPFIFQIICLEKNLKLKSMLKKRHEQLQRQVEMR